MTPIKIWVAIGLFFCFFNPIWATGLPLTPTSSNSTTPNIVPVVVATASVVTIAPTLTPFESDLIILLTSPNNTAMKGTGNATTVSQSVSINYSIRTGCKNFSRYREIVFVPVEAPTSVATNHGISIQSTPVSQNAYTACNIQLTDSESKIVTKSIELISMTDGYGIEIPTGNVTGNSTSNFNWNTLKKVVADVPIQYIKLHLTPRKKENKKQKAVTANVGIK